MSSNRIRSSTVSGHSNAFTERKQSIRISTLSAKSHTFLDNAIQEKKSVKYSIFRAPKSLQEKFLSFVICLLLVCVTVFLTSMWILCDRWKATLSQLKHIYIEEDDICETEACQETAEDIISNIDPATDPCSDFYQYACGGWMEKNPIPKGAQHIVASLKRRTEVEKQIYGLLIKHAKNDTCKSVRNAGKLYSACVNTKARNAKGLKSLQKLINDYGGWPMLGDGHWKEDSYVWFEQAAKVNRDLFLELFVEFEFNRNSFDNSIFILTLDSGYFIFEYENEENSTNENNTRAARDFIVNAARLMGSTLDKAVLREEALEVIELEKKLYVASNDFSSEYKYMSVADLQINVTDNKFFYPDYINLHIRSEVPVEENTEIYPLLLNYLRRFPDIVAETKQRTVANYIAFYIFDHLAGFSSDAAVNLTLKYDLDIGIRRSRNIKKACLSITKSMMPLALGRLYVDRYFPELTKLHVTKMLDMIRLAYSSSIDQNEWMDEQTLLFSLVKLKSIQSMIFHEDWILEDDLLDEYYSKVGDVQEDDFVSAIVSLDEIRADIVYSRWNTTAERGDPDPNTNDPTVMNAFYAPYNNFIALPAGIFGYPFYKYGRIDSINYGGIGTVIGHEISHAFDTSGRKYDHVGNKKNWWTNETLYKYYDKAQCFIDQYTNFEDPLSPLKADGKHTLKENIADNGGVKSAFKAFRLHLALSGENLSYRKRLPGLSASPEQLFFLGYASLWCGNMTEELAARYAEVDDHSPGKIRVNVPLSNFKEFAKAFKCKAGAPMNPFDKCSLW